MDGEACHMFFDNYQSDARLSFKEFEILMNKMILKNALDALENESNNDSIIEEGNDSYIDQGLAT